MGAQLDGYSPRKDGSVSLRFVTGEKMPSEIMDFHALMGKFGYLYFRAEEELTQAEIRTLDELETDLHDNPKTKSQRLRNTLYVYWKQDEGGFKEFKDFYDNRMEALIQQVKDRLEPE